jgi:DNA-binding transcriptional LysR family regulator
MMPSWDDLRILEVLERLGSANAAGRELGVAPSTIYRRIAALEEAVGFACVVRGAGPTPAGRELAELARSTGVAIKTIAQRSQQSRVHVRGVVTLTTLDGFTPLLAAPLAELSSTHPDLRVDVHISDVGASLRKRDADIALSLTQRPRDNLIARRLFDIHFAVFGLAKLAAAAKTARWVVLGQPLESSWLAQWEHVHVPRPRVAASSASRLLLVEMVRAGVGLGLLPRPLAIAHPELVEVEAFTQSASSLSRPAWLLYQPELRGDARVSTVVQVLSRWLSATKTTKDEVAGPTRNTRRVERT